MSTELILDTSEELNVTVRRGDSLSFDITVKDSSGDAVDLTSYNFDMDIRSKSKIPTKSGRNDVVLSNIPGGSNTLLLSLSGAADGTLTVSATREAMSGISAGSYNYDISASHITNSTSETWFFGKFTVNQDFTLR
jgi:hypothetical protein